MKRQHWLPMAMIALVMGLALVWGCSDDDTPTDPGGGGNGGGDPVGTITGIVYELDGDPLSGAAITDGTVATTANEDGYFLLASVPEGTAIVSIASTGYASTFRVVPVSEGSSTHFADIVLMPFESGTINAGAGGSVATGNGAGEVDFAGGTFVDGAGAPYDGEVTVQLNAMLPGEMEFYGAFPGDFSGIREDDSEVPFISYGFMTVEISGEDKAPLELAPGAIAALRLTIDETKAASAPATIPMWYFDETDGMWHEEGEATLEGNVYTAEVGHFTTWNWDLPVEDICAITGTVIDENEMPVAGARVISRSVGLAIMDEAVTNAAGAFEVRAVRNGLTDVWAAKGSLASEPVRVTVGDVCPLVLEIPLVLTVPAYSISLTWGVFPEDLDSHLLIPMTWDPAYDYYHIYYSSMGTLGDDPYAVLDTDDTSSYGPEIITGTRLYQGRFQYWVHNYDGDDSDELSDSGAIVQLEVGGGVYYYDVADVPLEGADPTGWWHVFDIVVSGSGSSITVESVMRFQPEFSENGVYADKVATAK